MDDSSAPMPTYNLLDWFLAPRLRRGTDLARMRRTAEELRDHPTLLRNALHVLLRDRQALAAVAARSSLHANGFVKVVLSRDDGWSLRLHVWSPVRFRRRRRPARHRWAFASWIITGILRETGSTWPPRPPVPPLRIPRPLDSRRSGIDRAGP